MLGKGGGGLVTLDNVEAEGTGTALPSVDWLSEEVGFCRTVATAFPCGELFITKGLYFLLCSSRFKVTSTLERV